MNAIRKPVVMSAAALAAVAVGLPAVARASRTSERHDPPSAREGLTAGKALQALMDATGAASRDPWSARPAANAQERSAAGIGPEVAGALVAGHARPRGQSALSAGVASPAQAPAGSWTIVPLPLPETGHSMAMDVQMLSADEGWAVGELGYGDTPDDPLRPAIWHMTGGQWRIVDVADPVPAGVLWALDMTSRDEGWAVVAGVRAGLLHYDGSAWRDIVLGTTNYGLYGIDMVSPSDGWIVGLRSLLHLESGTWTMIDPQFGGIDIEMTSTEEGWSVGGSEAHHYVAGGWRNVTFAEPISDMESVDAVGAGSVWIGGGQSGGLSGGYLQHVVGESLDGPPVPAANVIWDIEMLDESSGWAVGGMPSSSPSVIMRYDGRTWAPVASPITGCLHAVDMISPYEGWAAGCEKLTDSPLTAVLLHYAAPHVPTATPTAGITPAPSRTPDPQNPEPETCAFLQQRVPASVIAAALTNPARVFGWRQPCHPGVPRHPLNGLRHWLSLQDPGKPFHPLVNGLQYKCGCP